MKKNIAIFASGTGSNAKKIIEYFENHPHIGVSLVVSNKADAPVLEMAEKNNVATILINKGNFYTSDTILKKFNEYHVDFVALAGFLWLVPTYMVKAYEKRMVNIHPSLLPKYGGKGMYGMKVHQAVKDAGDTETGITIHYVNEEYDDGDIVFQTRCGVVPADTPETIAQKIHHLEHQHYPQIIESLLTA